jgi:TetR/AcrR family transcriptional regulator, regulator of autoinduction and epiphytic fitness
MARIRESSSAEWPWPPLDPRVPEPPPDGRAARADRTRTALVDALLELLDEGDLRPTAERIAARAGVSARSVFQHYPDREELYAAASQRQYERLGPRFRPVSAEGPLETRVRAFAGQAALFNETVTPVRRGALLLEPFSEVVAERLRWVRDLAKAEAERVFESELDERGADRERLAAAIAGVTAWTMWESLRAHQGLAVGEAEAVVRLALGSLLGLRD